MRKILYLVLSLVILVALSVAAAWGAGLFTGSVAIDGTATYATVEAEWSASSVSGNTTYGDTSVSHTASSLTITIDNAYPGYVGTVNATVKNTGSIPASVSGVISNGDSLELDMTGFTGTIIPDATSSGTIVLTVSGNATAGAVEPITGSITLVQAVP